MKNTFNTKRKKVNGMFPYLVKNEKGIECFLFEITLNTRLRDIVNIEDVFIDDSRLIFATIDKNVFNNIMAVTSANIFEVWCRKKRPLYFYNKSKFFKTTEITNKNIDFTGCTRLKITKDTGNLKTI